MVGATVVRYSFGVGLFHSFLDAGLSRRSRTTQPNDGRDVGSGAARRHVVTYIRPTDPSLCCSKYAV
jgi:hypothetical protein